MEPYTIAFFCLKSQLCYSQIGILRGLGRSKEAEQLARKVLAIREASFGTESRESASAYHCLAEVLADIDRLACASGINAWLIFWYMLADAACDFGCGSPLVSTTPVNAWLRPKRRD